MPPRCTTSTQRRLYARRGLTVFELLVGLAIVSIVSALVFPALFRAREAARRVQCTSNLHQIGIALDSYHAQHQSLPAGWREGGASATGWGWAASILPFLDQNALYDQIDFHYPVGDAENAAARLVSLPVFRCPSDPAPEQFALYREQYDDHGTVLASSAPSNGASDEEEVLFHLASANYIGVFGTIDPDTVAGDVGNGAFIANRGIRFAEVRDGLSNTLLVGERTSRQLLSTWAGMSPEGEEGPARVVGFADRLPGDPLADECEFSSRHTGGTLFLVADGAVRFVAEHVDRFAYQQMATRAGGR